MTGYKHMHMEITCLISNTQTSSIFHTHNKNMQDLFDSSDDGISEVWRLSRTIEGEEVENEREG